MSDKYRIISIDFDGVLNNMLDPYVAWLANCGIVTDIKDWDSYAYCRKHFPSWATDFWKREELYGVCRPFDGAVEFVVKLRNRYPDAILQIVTSTPDEITMFKNKMITSYFGCINYVHNVNHAWHKWEYTKDSILIDDFFVPLLGHSMVNKCPSILFNKDNIHPWVKIESLNEVLDHNKKYCTTYSGVLGAVDEYMQGC